MTVMTPEGDHEERSVRLTKSPEDVHRDDVDQHDTDHDDVGHDRVEGRIDIADRVVAKIAARAAVELPHVGAAAPRVFGRSMEALSSRSTDLDAIPKCDATVDGDHAFLSLTISIRWPQSVPDTCRELREHLSMRVQALTGLSVRDIDVNVDALASEQPRSESRVQ